MEAQSFTSRAVYTPRGVGPLPHQLQDYKTPIRHALKMNSKFTTETNHIPLHTDRDKNKEFGPFVTAVFTVSNGDIHKSLDNPDYALNNNHISPNDDISRRQKSNIKKSALSEKRHVSAEITERKSVSFTDDTLDNENSTRPLRKERLDPRRKQRLKNRRSQQTNSAYTGDEKEEIEQSIEFETEQNNTTEGKAADDTANGDKEERPFSNGHAHAVSNGGLVSALVDLDVTESSSSIPADSPFRPEETVDSEEFSSTELEFFYFDKLLRRVVSEQRRKKSCILAGVIFALIAIGGLCAGIAVYFLLRG